MRWMCGEPTLQDRREAEAAGYADDQWEWAYFLAQVCRQAFKTESFALYDATAVLNGCDVGFGMPSKSQAAVVTHQRVLSFIQQAERLGLAKRRGRGYPQQFSDWDVKLRDGSWGVGSLSLVGARAAMETTHRKSSQTGRTFHVLHLGEGQSLFDEDVAELEPSVLNPIGEGNGRINIEGVGGPSDSIIETYKQSGYRQFWCNSDMYLKENPQFRDGHEALASRHTSEWVDANLGCLPLSLGQRMLYPSMGADLVPPVHAGPKISFFGIDVGRTRDYTCIGKVDWWPGWFVNGRMGHGHVDQFFQIPHVEVEDQAQLVADWIMQFPYQGGSLNEPSCIGIETNGGHWGLHDVLKRHYFPFIHWMNLNGTEEDGTGGYQGNKHRAIQQLRVRFSKGEYGITQEARDIRTGNPPVRLGQLTFKINERGRYEYKHSDANSALVIAELVREMVLG